MAMSFRTEIVGCGLLEKTTAAPNLSAALPDRFAAFPVWTAGFWKLSLC